MTRNANQLRPGQVQALLDASPPAWRLAFALAAYAGLRAGEVCALRWRDVDFEKRGIVVRTPKVRSPRMEPMVRDLAVLLQAADPKAGDELVCMRDGKPWTVTGLREAFRRAQEQVSIAGYCFHDLRRFFLDRGGLPPTPRHTARDPEELRAAIATVEGPEWLEQDALRTPGHNSLAGAIQQWSEVGRGVIDGRNNLHRYVILADGEVVYSEMHGEAGVEQARAAGFRIEKAPRPSPAGPPNANTRHALLEESHRSLQRATATLVRYFELAMPSGRLCGEYRQAVSSIAPDIVQAAVSAMMAEGMGQPRAAALARLDMDLAGIERRPLMYARKPEALELQVLLLVEQRQVLRGDTDFDVASAFSAFVEPLNGEPNAGPLFAILRDAAPLPPDAPREGRLPEPRGLWKRGRLDELPRLLGDFGRWVEAGGPRGPNVRACPSCHAPRGLVYWGNAPTSNMTLHCTECSFGRDATEAEIAAVKAAGG